MKMIPLLSLIVFTVNVVAAWEAKQIFRTERYSRGDTNVRVIQEIDKAAWIGSAKDAPFVRFKKTFTVSANEPLTIDVSADERFILLCDGIPFSRGPHRSTIERWLYQTYTLNLPNGEHTLEAVVWKINDHAPLAQLSWKHGFILKANGTYDNQLTTGKAAWLAAPLSNTRMTNKGESGTFGVGSQCEVQGTAFLNETPPSSSFAPVRIVRAPVRPNIYGLRTLGWLLFPTTLPDQMNRPDQPGAFQACRSDPDEKTFFEPNDGKHANLTQWNSLLKNNAPFTIPANTTMRVIWDLKNYFCAYPECSVSGGKGAIIRWGWSESMKDRNGHKGDRNGWENKRFSGFVDTFKPDGRAEGFFTSPWWRCGKWCQIEVKTGTEPLTIRSIRIRETRYPTPPTASFECDDPSLTAVQRICVRGMQMCMHEMLFDCPYYEQQMYPGDTRVQLLTVGALNHDDRLIRRAIELYDLSRRDNGMVAMNFPTRGLQESSTYTLCWPLMFRDYLYWHAHADWLKARMPGLRHTMHSMALYENQDGLLENLPGWSFIDWVPEWNTGIAPNGSRGEGVSAINNLFYLLALQSTAEVESAFGETLLARYWKDKADRLGKRILQQFWAPARGLIADTVKKDKFSEHAQCLAILSRILPPDQEQRLFQKLLETKDLSRTTVYFSHYLFETYLKHGRADLFLKRLDLWRDYVKMNMCTPLESPGEARSDCHAWGSHPLFHLHAGVAGVQPDAPFFRRVRIAPNPGSLTRIHAHTPHPDGEIVTELTFRNGGVNGTITLPDGINGTFVWKGKSLPLHPGKQTIQQP